MHFRGLSVQGTEAVKSGIGTVLYTSLIRQMCLGPGDETMWKQKKNKKHGTGHSRAVRCTAAENRSEMIFSVFSGADQILPPINLFYISVYLVVRLMCVSN